VKTFKSVHVKLVAEQPGGAGRRRGGCSRSQATDNRPEGGSLQPVFLLLSISDHQTCQEVTVCDVLIDPLPFKIQ